MCSMGWFSIFLHSCFHGSTPRFSDWTSAILCVYISPVSRLFDSFGLVHHFYADDTTFFLPSDPVPSSLNHLESCSSALCCWFLFNGLQLNPKKSEVFLVGTREGCKSLSPLLASGLTIAGTPLPLSSSVKILGVTFDSTLSFDAHVSEIYRSANYHLSYSCLIFYSPICF